MLSLNASKNSQSGYRPCPVSSLLSSCTLLLISLSSPDTAQKYGKTRLHEDPWQFSCILDCSCGSPLASPELHRHSISL